MTLYELKDEYRQLLEMMEDPETDPEALQCTMDMVEEEIEDKAEAYAIIINELTAKAEQIMNEAKRLSEWNNTIRMNITRLKDRLMTSMIDLGMKKIETKHFRLSVAGNGGKQPLRLTGEVPEEYMYMKPEIDMMKIREALDNGIVLDFAHLEERGRHLNIK